MPFPFRRYLTRGHFYVFRFHLSVQVTYRSQPQHANMNAAEEQRITSAKAELQRIQNSVQTGSHDWDRHITAARGIIASIDSTSLMQRVNRSADQTFIISGLQNLAYHDPDSGGVQDIAEWCVSQWLRMVQRDPEHVNALQGMLHNLCFLILVWAQVRSGSR
jgi:hypothetical protein